MGIQYALNPPQIGLKNPKFTVIRRQFDSQINMKGRDVIMARTGENIYKRKDGRWEARFIHSYDANGKAKYKYLYGKSRQDAKQKLQTAVCNNILGKESMICPISQFKGLAEQWLYIVQLCVKASTFARYHNQVHKHILPRLGKYLNLLVLTL